MNEFTRNLQIRWSDLDPNFHLRHSVYYDWGAFCRMEFLTNYGLTTQVMQQLNIGLILFKEECVFRKEVQYGDDVTIGLQIILSKKDYSRWSIQHQIMKNKEILCAVLRVDGAWMNIRERKLASPPEIVHEVFEQMPRSDLFEWL